MEDKLSEKIAEVRQKFLKFKEEIWEYLVDTEKEKDLLTVWDSKNCIDRINEGMYRAETVVRSRYLDDLDKSKSG